MKFIPLLSSVVLLANLCKAFVIRGSPSRLAASSLSGYIAADSTDEVLPPLEALTLKENPIMIYGSASSSGLSANGIKHYSKLTQVTDATMEDGSLVAVGRGKEVYQDPGMSTEKYIVLAPLEAAQEVMKDLQSKKVNIGKASKWIVTFTGGEDLMVNEVLEAVQMIQEGLSRKGEEPKMEFSSVSSNQFPVDICEIAVFVSSEKNGKDIPYIYTNNNQWYTLSEQDYIDINS